MGKKPGFYIYVMDWSRDLEEHSLEIDGAWFRICRKIFWTGGEAAFTIDQWAKVLGVTPRKTANLLGYLCQTGIGTFEDAFFEFVANSDRNRIEIGSNLDRIRCEIGTISVACRRMVKDLNTREDIRLRVEKHREKHTFVTQMKQPSSISLSYSGNISRDILLEWLPKERIDLYITAISLCKFLRNCIKKLDLKARIPDKIIIGKGWVEQARKLLELDERGEVEIREVILFANQHYFWKSNILSMGKLREKYTTLLLQMKESENGKGIRGFKKTYPRYPDKFRDKEKFKNRES
jgi:hypothetical protein